MIQFNSLLTVGAIDIARPAGIFPTMTSDFALALAQMGVPAGDATHVLPPGIAASLAAPVIAGNARQIFAVDGTNLPDAGADAPVGEVGALPIELLTTAPTTFVAAAPKRVVPPTEAVEAGVAAAVVVVDELANDAEAPAGETEVVDRPARRTSARKPGASELADVQPPFVPVVDTPATPVAPVAIAAARTSVAQPPVGAPAQIKGQVPALDGELPVAAEPVVVDQSVKPRMPVDVATPPPVVATTKPTQPPVAAVPGGANSAPVPVASAIPLEARAMPRSGRVDPAPRNAAPIAPLTPDAEAAPAIAAASRPEPVVVVAQPSVPTAAPIAPAPVMPSAPIGAAQLIPVASIAPSVPAVGPAPATPGPAQASPPDALVSDTSIDVAATLPRTPVAPSVVTPQPAAQVFAAAMFEAREAADAVRDEPIGPAIGVGQQAPPLQPTATQAPQPVTTQPPIDATRREWMDQMIERIETMRSEGGGRETRIRLTPDALGAVDVAITHDENGVQVRLVADTPQARALLAEAAPRLAEMAEARGLKLANANVDPGTAGTRQEQRDPRQPDTPGSTRPASAFAAANDDTGTDTRIA